MTWAPATADYRGAGLGYLRDQIRGNAWALREVVDAAAMTPPEMPEKADIDSRIANNITAWNNAYIVNGQLLGKYPTVRLLRHLGHRSVARSSDLLGGHRPSGRPTT